MLYIDIDEFKSVNDSLGHLIGDELLKSVAVEPEQLHPGRPTSSPGSAATNSPSCRPRVEDAADVTDLVNRIFEAIRAPYDCLGHQVTTDASIGIALAPQDGTDLDQILKNADLAMYAAKSAGRRTYRFFEPDMDAQVTRAPRCWKSICARRSPTAVRGLLPALSRPAEQRDHRLRGAAALAPSASAA